MKREISFKWEIINTYLEEEGKYLVCRNVTGQGNVRPVLVSPLMPFGVDVDPATEPQKETQTSERFQRSGHRLLIRTACLGKGPEGPSHLTARGGPHVIVYYTVGDLSLGPVLVIMNVVIVNK